MRFGMMYSKIFREKKNKLEYYAGETGKRASGRPGEGGRRGEGRRRRRRAA